MSYTVGNRGILSGTIQHPMRGTWNADLEIASAEPLTGAQTLRLPGLELVGYVEPDQSGVTALRQKIRMVGGKGGLSKAVAGQHFNSTTVRTVVEYLLRGAGEALASDSDSGILSTRIDHWQHTTETAARGLDDLIDHLGSYWYVKPDGTVRIGEPAWAVTLPEYVILDEDKQTGTWTISTLTETLIPGVTFLDKRVRAVEHMIEEGGPARTEVRWNGDDLPLDEDWEDLVQRYQLRTLPSYAARVVTVNGDGTLDLEPVRQKVRDEVGPGWKKVPLYLVGAATVKVQPGALCLVEFEDNDRSAPFVRSFKSGTFSEISETATSKIESKAPTMNLGENNAAMTLAGSSKPVLRVGDPVAGLTSAAAGSPVTGTYGTTPPTSTVKA